MYRNIYYPEGIYRNSDMDASKIGDSCKKLQHWIANKILLRNSNTGSRIPRIRFFLYLLGAKIPPICQSVRQMYRKKTASSLLRNSLNWYTENGMQLVQFDKLLTLTMLYGVSVNGLTRPGAVQVNLIPRFRCLYGSQTEAVIDAAKLLN